MNRRKQRTQALMQAAARRRTDRMTQDVAMYGGEYSFKIVKGQIQDVHHTGAAQ